MTKIFVFRDEIVQDGYRCPFCGASLWDADNDMPGDALGFDEDQPEDLYCAGCGTPVPVGHMTSSNGKISYMLAEQPA